MPLTNSTSDRLNDDSSAKSKNHLPLMLMYKSLLAMSPLNSPVVLSAGEYVPNSRFVEFLRTFQHCGVVCLASRAINSRHCLDQCHARYLTDIRGISDPAVGGQPTTEPSSPTSAYPSQSNEPIPFQTIQILAYAVRLVLERENGYGTVYVMWSNIDTQPLNSDGASDDLIVCDHDGAPFI